MTTNLRFPVALHILTLLAASGSGLLTSDEIAASVDTNPVVIRRVMASLRAKDLVESRPGSKGGWRLLKPARAITLSKVLESVQEDELLTVHAHPNPHCPIGSHIRDSLQGRFMQAELALHRSLSTQTIADVLKDVRALGR